MKLLPYRHLVDDQFIIFKIASKSSMTTVSKNMKRIWTGTSHENIDGSGGEISDIFVEISEELALYKVKCVVDSESC